MTKETVVRAAADGAVSEASVGRLPLYLRVLTDLHQAGVATVSSEALAEATGVQPALLRRDLNQFGHYGVRGVGYGVEALQQQVARLVGTTRVRGVVIVGVGRLGRALVDHAGLARQGFEVVALVDVDPQLVGTSVAGVSVNHERDLADVVTRTGAELGIIATPASAAQHAAEALLAAGVASMLNLAPTLVRLPQAAVRSVDIAQELQILSFHHAQREVLGPDRARPQEAIAP